MWPLCTTNSPLWLLLPLLIGLVTGWWAWSRKTADASYDGAENRVSRDTAWPDTAAAGPVAEPKASSPALKVVDGSEGSTSAATPLSAIGIPAAVGESDDLRLIKGVGPKLNDLLQSLGVRRFDQIAAWGGDEIAKVDTHLGAFSGRIERDDWVEQAKLLAKGAIDEFNARFGGMGTNT